MVFTSQRSSSSAKVLTFLVVTIVGMICCGSIAATKPAFAMSNQGASGSGSIVRYNGPGNGTDTPYDVVANKDGRAYVTGTSRGINGKAEYATVAYNADGSQAWVARYAGPGFGNSTAMSIFTDAQGYVYVTGQSVGVGTGQDVTTIKYNAQGNQLWVKRYNGSANGDDVGNTIVVDEQGFVYVAASVQNTGTDSDVTTIKYDADGNQVWLKSFNKTGTWQNKNDFAKQVLLDSQGNIYVIGTSDGFSAIQDYLVLKYNPAGSLLWLQTYNGTSNWMDRIQQAALDKQDNLYVTGSSSGLDWDYATVKYTPDGVQQWVQRYDAGSDGIDSATSIVLDNDANVYVTGTSQDDQGVSRYTTLKYNASGEQLWIQQYPATSCQGSDILQLGVDQSNNIYIVGCVTDGTTGKNLLTLKYTAAGMLSRVQQYDDVVNNADLFARYVRALFVDPNGTVYVATQSESVATGIDYLLLKEQSNNAPVSPIPSTTITPSVTLTTTPTTASPTTPVATSPTDTTTTTPTIATPTAPIATSPTDTTTATLTTATPSTPTTPVATSPTDTTTATPTTPVATSPTTPVATSPTGTPSTPTTATPSTPTVTLPTAMPSPTLPTTEYGVTINDGALFTKQVSVTLTLGARPGTTEMQISNDGGFGGAQWEPYALHKPWQITQYGTYVLPRVVYVRFKDASGGMWGAYQDDILLDVTPPSGGAWVATGGALTTAAAGQPVLHLEASDDVSGVAGMRLSATQDFERVAWMPFAASYAWDFSANPAVYVEFRDGSGNISQAYAAKINAQLQVFLPLLQR